MYSDFELFVDNEIINKKSAVFKIIDHTIEWTTPTKIIAFDFDHTLVSPKEGRTFSKGLTDWEWMASGMISTIYKYIQDRPTDTYHLYIISNQQNRVFKLQQIMNVATIIQKRIKELNVPVMTLVLYDKKLKKPNTTLIQKILSYYDTVPDTTYIGDAMGRVHDWSDSDLQFAKNMGFTPNTPEDFFPQLVYKEDTTIYELDHLEYGVYILVGSPASGKTTLATQIYDKDPSNVHVISRDLYKTKSKFLKEVSNTPINKIVIIDATHPSIKARQEVIHRLDKKDVNIIHLNTPIAVAKQRNSQRDTPVPTIAFSMYCKNFVMPTSHDNQYIRNVYSI